MTFYPKVTLEPSTDFNAPVFVTFSEVELSTASSIHEAISYTRGERNFTCTIYYGQKPGMEAASHIMVNMNLDRILRRLRRSTEQRQLWVDVICINQPDY